MKQNTEQNKSNEEQIISIINGQYNLNIDVNKLNELIYLINSSIKSAVLNYGLLPKSMQKLAVISGAGIAGLSASLELINRGYKVIIAEKRSDFTRFNIINLDIDVQRFLNKFGLLAEFERDVAGKIKFHKYVLSTENGIEHLGTSDVSQLRFSNIPFSPEFFDKLFTNDGVYSVKIKDLQNFLAKKALDAGIHIFGNVETNVLEANDESNKIKITGLYDEMELKPDLFLIAEGAHSTTASHLGMENKQVVNECTGEEWIFGNFKYSGSETFVVSVIDTSGDELEIANIIFNSKVHEINVAITSRGNLSQDAINARLLSIVNKVLISQNIDEKPELISAVTNPVHIINEKRSVYSKGNVFCIGDAAGHSSPLAGMGGTLGLTLVPATVVKLIEDSEKNKEERHDNFDRHSDASVKRWMNKSEIIKTHCLGLFLEKKPTVKPDTENTVNLKNGR